MKVKHACFCFHPRFDTGTWSIAVAFTTLVSFLFALNWYATHLVLDQCVASRECREEGIQRVQLGGVRVVNLCLFSITSSFSFQGWKCCPNPELMRGSAEEHKENQSRNLLNALCTIQNTTLSPEQNLVFKSKKSKDNIVVTCLQNFRGEVFLFFSQVLLW